MKRVMTPEAQRIAIAETCGWKWEILWTGELHGKPIGEQGPLREVPDYLNDLNAMHKPEKFILSTDLYIQYVNYLFRSVGLNRTYYMGATPEVFPADRQFAVFHAGASQRAEAFLRTIGKWEAESKWAKWTTHPVCY